MYACMCALVYLKSKTTDYGQKKGKKKSVTRC